MSFQTKMLIGGSFAALAHAPAMAADLPSKSPAVAPAPVFLASSSWTGFYVGVQGGYVSSRSTITGTGYDAWGGPNATLNQFAIGGLAGYDQQFGRLVAGVLGDVNARFGNATSSLLGPGAANGWRTSSTWDASLRMRLGYLVVDNTLAYVTGGLAFANYKLDNPSSPGSAVWRTANIIGSARQGWTVGAGLEHKMTNNWRLKAEYLFADYGVKKTHLPNVGISAGEDDYIRSRIKSHTLRIGLVYQFGSQSAPVAAKY